MYNVADLHWVQSSLIQTPLPCRTTTVVNDIHVHMYIMYSYTTKMNISLVNNFLRGLATLIRDKRNSIWKKYIHII